MGPSNDNNNDDDNNDINGLDWASFFSPPPRTDSSFSDDYECAKINSRKRVVWKLRPFGVCDLNAVRDRAVETIVRHYCITCVGKNFHVSSAIKNPFLLFNISVVR